MFKTLALTIAAGAISALLAVEAGASPLAQSKLSVEDGAITFVRQGCGPGMRYSSRERRCVGESPIGIVREVIRPGRDCGPGRHYSRRFDRCVRN